MLKAAKVPEATIRRLSTYTRYLKELEEKGETVVSSAQLAKACGVNPAQVRKDLAYFGEFGIRGVGYYVKDLYEDLRRILGLNREWRLAIIGIGNLGTALLNFKDFLKENYKIVAAFDIKPEEVVGRVAEKVGKPVEILHPDRLKEVARERKIDIAIITTPPSEAQKVADQVVEANIRGILNFTPAQLRVPRGYIVKNVYFTTILDNLVYLLQSRRR
ncbi:MAG: redox-sensing transcriptional repressor Rex [Deltaproteobacteria bacterium]|nr:MAG: redox-sensing transcriptional repressor Rex [Deltaproteobacteria bacterium]HEX16359.1 redox-sensing transcriptional repressor Rex [Deltaproteobacteria bacterium]